MDISILFARYPLILNEVCIIFLCDAALNYKPTAHACTCSRDLADWLCRVVQKVAAGGPPLVVGRALAAARLIALQKGNGDVCPIAIGDALRCLVARSICVQEKASMADAFSPVQYGVAVPGGLEQVVHQVQAGLEAHVEWALFKCDISNAFNSVSRSSFFQQTSRHLPSIMPFTEFLYSQPSPLIYKGSRSVTVLTSREGVHQGDPRGPFYFCIAINDILLQLQQDHDDTLVSGFFDDVSLLGLPGEIGGAPPRPCQAVGIARFDPEPQKV